MKKNKCRTYLYDGHAGYVRTKDQMSIAKNPADHASTALYIILVKEKKSNNATIIKTGKT
ncbi:hypothetical protein HYT01_02190 [Candidatus Giovannonibacteria bacterium]|nr:hypothetical protein [Candidatus Giovannonibacteria bacterium]